MKQPKKQTNKKNARGGRPDKRGRTSKSVRGNSVTKHRRSSKSVRGNSVTKRRISQMDELPDTMITPSIGMPPTRKSKRGLDAVYLPVLTLGKGDPSVPTYNDQMLSKDVIIEFIANKIKPGYQIVTFPMPPVESHSIIVHVSDSFVKIVDKNGESSRLPKLIKKKIDEDATIKWKNYVTFVNCLEQKYDTKVSYYPVEEDIHQMACDREKKNDGQGGCSEYVDNWAKRHLGENDTKAVLLEPM